MATENEIYAWFATLKARIHEIAGADLPISEQGAVKELAGVSLCIGESVVLDLNRIANALEKRNDQG